MDDMIEIERKFLVVLPPERIERDACEVGTVRSRRLIQQRYLPTREWRIRLSKTVSQSGTRHRLVLRKDGVGIPVDISEKMHEKLCGFCSEAKIERMPCGGIAERRKLRNPHEWVLRIRRTSLVSGCGARFEITMKKPIGTSSCHEPESTITAADHDAIAPFCGAVLRKRRVKIRHHGNTFELDTFLNPELDGLAIAEVELPSVDATVPLPEWIGEEVTHLREYRNAVIEKRIL